ncbi:hypothetical protein RND71_023242 [Anisodus tanguticus]|uniref:Uncharacterized protein n=1 Tax=Anisodus tanguticus TaxID=243964 RepID=A0AAE1RV60_9SOLA|nr:hypothetical protein RND71_023242 [Anisodus tanguticus]
MELERQANWKDQKVLLDRVFDFDIAKKYGMKELMEIVKFQKWYHLFVSPAPSAFEKEVAVFYDNVIYTDNSILVCSVNGVELGVPTDGLKIIEGKASDDFKNLIKAWVERRCIASIADMVLLEAIASFHSISLPALVIKHMIKVINAREGNHGLPYVFFLTKVFKHFNVLIGNATIGTRKQMFTMSTLEECECVPKKGGIGSNSTISSLIEAQERATADIERLQAENALLMAQLVENTR